MYIIYIKERKKMPDFNLENDLELQKKGMVYFISFQLYIKYFYIYIIFYMFKNN